MALIMDLDEACHLFHEAYERHAPLRGWQTHPDLHVPFADCPEANQETMRDAMAELLRELGVTYTREA